MGPRRPSRWEGTILWEPYLHTQLEVYGEERTPGHLCARNSKRTKRTRQGGRRELSICICCPIFDGASQFFCLPIFVITYSAGMNSESQRRPSSLKADPRPSWSLSHPRAGIPGSPRYYLRSGLPKRLGAFDRGSARMRSTMDGP